MTQLKGAEAMNHLVILIFNSDSGFDEEKCYCQFSSDRMEKIE